MLIDSETATQTAVNQLNAIIARWKTAGIDQFVVDLANKFLSPTQANEMIQSARTGLAGLDMDNGLTTLAATLEKI